MSVSIVIPSFNGQDELLELIDRLLYLLSRGNFDAYIVVVDNASEDDSIKRLKKKLEKEKTPQKIKVKVIRNSKNLGFAKAANQGIRYSLEKKSDYILLLNQDVTLPDSFSGFIVDKKSDISAPVISFYKNSKKYFDHGGKINFFLGRTYHIEKEEIEARAEKVDFVSGCCMLVRSDVFDKIGLFDERFYLYFEDVDFCRRSKMNGFTVSVNTDYLIHHNIEQISDRSFNKRKSLIYSNYLFVRKHVVFPAKVLGYLYVGFLFLKVLVLKM